MRSTFILVWLFALSSQGIGKKSSDENKPEWAKKDIRDYSDADLERLLDQWEVRIFFLSEIYSCCV